ncbi:hypothetical protein CBR_g2981 [Chara braunii]|uniref:Uncharacterized protein n=1 Tax=Chara braunii TaxID=69332 RepID=A0A388KEK7_CHABU|nr:hypothetical protein CBR_g2981 [Chara braunii]|eukprot:GBG68437.1 hypothetical protein CBR_g2981 [Chara braunii]
MERKGVSFFPLMIGVVVVMVICSMAILAMADVNEKMELEVVGEQGEVADVSGERGLLGGRCRPACASGSSCCGGVCRNLQTSRNNCGGCGRRLRRSAVSEALGGGYRKRDNDDRFDKIYDLLSEQAEERERKKQEAAKLELFEAEKKKLQAEEERNVQARKKKELHEARLGKIVRSRMKSVCESVLGKKIDIPDEDESEITKVKRELDELKAKYVGEKARCAGEKAESSLDALRREKEALQKEQSLRSEEEILKKEIEILRARNEKNKSIDAISESSQSDEIAALRLQIQELEGVQAALQNRSNELCSLKAENLTLKKDFQDLRMEIDELKNANNKRSSEVVTDKSPPAEPDKGKQSLVSIGDAVYTPKDLDALHKAYKKAQAGEEIANKEVQALKERMARMGAQLLTKQCPSAIRSYVRKTTPRNLRPALSAIQIEDDESKKEGGPWRTKAVEKLSEKPEEVQLKKLQEEERRTLRPFKKADMSKLCEEEGITYIKLDQAKANVAEIRARRRFAQWLKDQGLQDEDEDDHEQHYATSTEDINDE